MNEKWITKNTSDLTGKVVAVTGATGGLGSVLCEYLATLNASILMLNRDYAKSMALKEKLLSRFPNADVDFLKLDLGDAKNVKSACNELQSKQIDYLILNAGIYNVPLKTLELGHNNVFQVNFVSHYCLVRSLLPNLRKCGAKVIVVSSIAQKFAKLRPADADYSHSKRSNKIYGNSKRFLTYALAELFQTETDAHLATAHPGVTLTNMTGHYPKAINWFVKGGVKLLFPSPQKATRCIVKAMFCDCPHRKWIGPAVMDIWGKPKIKKLRSCSESESAEIFEIAEQAYDKFQNEVSM